ncbi:ogr/Delta-like zinc finger family protein [Pseudomonas aeruginosa]|uniref:ogr/Delta-like zinc finger family protein n=1 Tax=Pseudomonas aeruginosa TaxID=287 RepID=UPI003F4B7380
MKLYCQCNNGHCGHRFVMHLTFSHALIGPYKPVDQLLFSRLREMPLQDRRALLEQLDNLPTVDPSA